MIWNLTPPQGYLGGVRLHNIERVRFSPPFLFLNSFCYYKTNYGCWISGKMQMDNRIQYINFWANLRYTWAAFHSSIDAGCKGARGQLPPGIVFAPLDGIVTFDRKMTTFRQSENIIAL